jgi:sugar lactone lactonase YvrE
MCVLPLKFPRKYSPFSFVALLTGLVVCSGVWGSSARAAVPAVVIDAQQALGSGYNNPQSIAVSKNGTVYVADTDNNQIVALTPNTPFSGDNNVVTTTPYVLTTPQALALDANGDLYVADTPTSGGRIIELLGDGNGNLTGGTKLIFSGAPLTNPISLALDSTGTLFIGDYNNSADPTVATIFSLAPAATTLTQLSLGLPTTIIPAALVRDSSTNLYVADNGSTSNSVYKASLAGNTSALVPTQAFAINQPSGLALDGSGNLYILSLLGTGSGYNPGQQVVVVPAASPSTPYILPNTGIGASSSLAFDSLGNLDLADSADGIVFQLGFVGSTYMGTALISDVGPPVAFNFEFNQPATLRGFQITSAGDISTELTQSTGGTCANGAHNTLPNGGPAVSPYYPYTCYELYVGSPAYPGERSSAIEVKGPTGTILASTPVYQFGFSGAEIAYPLNSTTTATNLEQPQAIAISGLDKTVYIADTQASQVYSTKNLNGTALTPVSTGTIALSSPTGLAVDGTGNLYIVDFDNADLVEVPTTTGVAPFVVPTGGLLQHPIAVAVDYVGNLYIGDAGPGGVNAGTGNPGYIVQIPVGGTPFKMTIPSVSIVFPQALTTDPYLRSLIIGDGGDPSGVGQVVQVTADGTTANVIPLNNVTDPSGLGYDPAGDLYVLDGLANTVTVQPAASSGLPQYNLPFDNSGLSAASAMAISNGGQSLLIGNIGGGSTNSLVYVNGNRSTLSFGSHAQGTTSAVQTAIVINIGNNPMTLSSPYYTVNTPNSAFDLSTSECSNGAVIAPSGACTINVTFTPSAVGHTTEQITVDSDAYNSAVPILTVQGTGTAAAAAKPARAKR